MGAEVGVKGHGHGVVRARSATAVGSHGTMYSPAHQDRLETQAWAAPTVEASTYTLRLMPG